MKKEENYNNKASTKKWDKLIKESGDAYLIENINKQKNKNVIFCSASLFTSFNISNNNTINKINNIKETFFINVLNQSHIAFKQLFLLQASISNFIRIWSIFISSGLLYNP